MRSHTTDRRDIRRATARLKDLADLEALGEI
jgi:hypothetical protein